jgi:phosphopantetheine--protein transferase-like protein
MKSNLAHQPDAELAEMRLANTMVWVSRPVTDQSVAMIVDDGALSEAELLVCLSQEEKFSAGAVDDSQEKRHFLLRRAFQRSFIKKVAGLQDRLSNIPLKHQRDRRPVCLSVPGLCLSFSSSGTTAMACAAGNSQVGIDVEHLRPVSNPLALSTRFFSGAETAYLASLPKMHQETEFLKLWTIKEACLKAVGKGVIHGLESFIISAKAGIYSVQPTPEFGQAENWTINLLDVAAEHTVALACFAPSLD